MKICANTECQHPFAPTRHNQKYCSNECCRLVTNNKLKQQYHERRARIKGQMRICVNCNITRLSRYNERNICQSCINQEESIGRMSLLQLVGAR